MDGTAETPAPARRRRPPSLRRQLLLWLLVPMLLAGAILVLDAARRARAEADEAFDRLLKASALAISERVVVVAGEPMIDLPYIALEMLTSTTQDRVFYKVTGPSGAMLTGYRDLPPPPAGTKFVDSRPIFYDAQYRGAPVRVALLPRLLTGGDVAESGWMTVQVAQTRGERDLLASRIVEEAVAQLVAMMAAGALAAWFAVSRGLAPLDRLKRAIRARSPDDLRPLTDPVPSEVRDLVGALNQLLGRVEASHTAMRRFIADASHQLRTPLAGLKTQAELGLRETAGDGMRQALERLRDMTDRTNRLAAQLLVQARAEPGASPALVPLDLAALAREATVERVPAALARSMDLGFEGPEVAVPVKGDAVLLGETIGNLIDNAIGYGDRGGTITVRVDTGRTDRARMDTGRIGPEREQVVLTVEDDGPGIPPEARARVFERFYRVPGNRSPGAGLGLAIVAAAVERHGGQIELADPPGGRRGLVVRVTLPAAAPVAEPGAVPAAAP